MNADLENILDNLKTEIKSYNKALIALSGGVDSCLVTYLCRNYLGKEKCLAVISNSESLKQKDFEIATDFCETHDINYRVIKTNELENENYYSNPINRCYFCKNELYNSLKSMLENEYKNFVIVNGNNFSDLGDYRPGLKAAEEQNIFSPFIACKVDKDDIRKLAKHFNLKIWDKPASPCLSSRFPYGEQITKDKLKMVEYAESILNKYGFDNVRVRSIKNNAKIEVPPNQIMVLKEKIIHIKEEIKNLGFYDCLIDEEGFISGKLNRVLNEFQN